MSSNELTSWVAHQAVSARLSDLPEDCAEMARHAILDWFGVTIAGYDEPLAKILRKTYASGGECTIVGGGARASARDAALINGSTAHALDYDDVNIFGHPTAPIFAAALAVGEALGKSPEDILLAFVVGYEAATSVAVQAMPSNYERGFHSTGTIGAIGTAVAAAKLYDLGHEDTCEAIGLAVTQAAGLKGMFGTMAKPFHAGKAAFNGIMAAELAAAGFEARPDSLEMERGFFSTQTDASPHVPENYRFGDHIKKNLFKYHAACYCTHATLEATHQILRDQEIAPDQVQSVVTNVPEMHLATANIQSPETGLETKFSLKHCVVLALTGADTSAIGTYSDASANDPELMALRDRVTVNGNRPLGSDAVVEITMLDGKTHSAFYDAWIPEESLANQKEKLVRKFESLTRDRLGGGWRDASEVFVAFDRLGSVQDVFAPLMADA